MTHVALHRCRFVDYPPAQITALAFSHPSTPLCTLPPPKTLRLAVGRSNGTIEIWNPLNGAWSHETTVGGGGKDRSIESLAWAQDYDPHGKGLLRLFSANTSSVVTEWDLASGQARRHVDCNGGPIWSIAAQPRRRADDIPEAEREEEELCAQKIVVGTDDGTISLLSTANGELTFIRHLVRSGTKKSRVLSLAWQGRQTVVAGMADSTIRVWDIRSGRSMANMSVSKIKGREVLVWQVCVTPSGLLVSGDSRGELCFWDSKNYTLLQRIQAHKADCTALEIGGQNGEYLFSGSLDMRTALHKLKPDGRWGFVKKRRFHKHDVRALASFECGTFSVLVSGGADMSPIVTPIRNFEIENHMTLPLVPQHQISMTVPDSRLIISFWERQVKIWRVHELSTGAVEESGRTLISSITLSNEENITSACIEALPNASGYILAVSTLLSIKLFYLRPSKRGTDALRVSKIPIPSQLPVTVDRDASDSDDDLEKVNLGNEGARILQFSRDNQLAVITPNSDILIAKLSITTCEPANKPGISVLGLNRLDRDLGLRYRELSKVYTPSKKPSKRRADDGTHGVYQHTITRVAFSEGSEFLAVSDLNGNIATFACDTTDQSWTLLESQIPQQPSAISVLSFRPPSTFSKPNTSTSPDTSRLLVVPTASHHILEFSAASGLFTSWSKRNLMPEKLPKQFSQIRDRAISAWWENERRVWIWGASFVSMFDLSRDLPIVTSTALTLETPLGKRKRGGCSGAGDVAIELRGAVTPVKERGGIITDDEMEFDEDDVFEASKLDGTDDDDHYEDGKGKRKRKGQQPYWVSHRYKDLLGFLPVGGKNSVHLPSAGKTSSIEICVIERPRWSVEMPPRWEDGE